ncbi:transcriptional regulator [Sphingomonas oleivorans]|uniref:Transcriptional regulator n=1 Tax=Sphingomonas oleivorans TaxID=1735121 RepID=A0A2T5FV52_9SPHN|nr:cupin domain-containing protein [Sphingomonas oleivorans]PTQ08589.1 transcriptional regulator [Sphingomonas oleivorans]
MPKLDLDAFPLTNRTGYPAPYSADVAGRRYRRLGPGAGLEDFGVTHVTLEPGAWSSQRHWHEGEDEFVVMLSGEAVLVEEGSRVVMRAGDCAAFPKGKANAHHLVNEGERPCVFIAIGRPAASACHYPDIDLYLDGATQRYAHRDGTPY